MNGAVSRLSPSGDAVARMRNELRDGGYDVIHVHEPITPVLGWDACFATSAPVVGTFHVYSSSWIPNAIARGLGAKCWPRTATIAVCGLMALRSSSGVLTSMIFTFRSRMT